MADGDVTLIGTQEVAIDDEIEDIVAYPISNSVVLCAYSVAHNSANHGGRLVTRTINSNGSIGAEIDTLIFDSGYCRYLSPIVKLDSSSDKYALMYNYTSSELGIKFTTVQVNSDGTIENAIIDSHVVNDLGISVQGSFLHVSGDVYVYTWQDTGNSYEPHISTIDINSDGTIDVSPEIADWSFNSGVITYVMDIVRYPETNIFAVVYSGSNSPQTGTIMTCSVADNGTITESVLDSFDFLSGDYPQYTKLEYISPSILVLTFEEHGTRKAYIKTLSFASNGTLGDATLDSEELVDSGAAVAVSLAIHLDDIVLVAFKNGSDVGNFESYQINSGTGSITVIDSTTYGAIVEMNQMVKFGEQGSNTLYIVGSSADVDEAGMIYTFHVAGTGSGETVSTNGNVVKLVIQGVI